MTRFDGLIQAVIQKQHEIEIPESESLNIQASEVSGIQTSKNLDAQLSKSKNPTYQRTTLYLPKALHRQFKRAAVDEDREMSEIMEELIQDWLALRIPKHSDA